MANGLLHIARAAEDPDFQRRVKGAMYQLINATLTATATASPNDSGARGRSFVAQQIAAAPASYVSQFAWLCAATPVVRDSVVDEGGVIKVEVSDDVLLALAKQTWAFVAS